MKKRVLCLLLSFLFIAALCPGMALADFDWESITAPNLIVIDSNDLTASEPIYERGADDKVFPASTTKMMTCILSLENASPDQEVTVGSEIKGLFELKHGYTENSSLMGLVEGETVTIRDLLYGLMLVSGNEAADALAVAIGGSIDGFVSMMNSKAAELGMTGTHFVNPNGVHNDEHYVTARDMAKLTAYCMQNNQFATIVRTATYTVPANNVRTSELNLINSNLLLTAEGRPQYASYPYEYCIGVKTGYTTKAGNCLVASAEKNGAKPIVCLYADQIDDMNNDRFAYAKNIFEYVFNEVYTTIQAQELSLPTEFSCKITNAREEDLNENGELELSVALSNQSVTSFPAKINAIRSNSSSITTEIEWTDSLAAPVRQGQQLGTVKYIYNGDTLFTADLISPKDVLEVAVLSQPEGTDSDGNDSTAVPASASLLTGSETPSENETPKKGMSPFVVIILVLLGILILALAVILVAAAQRKKKQQKLKEQRRQQRMRQQASGNYARQGNGPRPSGRSPQASSQSQRPRQQSDGYSSGNPSRRYSNPQSGYGRPDSRYPGRQNPSNRSSRPYDPDRDDRRYR